MISTIAHWPTGPVRLRWVPHPHRYAEPVTAVHCFCFAGDQLVLVDVSARGLSIPGGHVSKGERLTDSLHRELAEEAFIVLGESTLLGAVECDHSQNPQFDATTRYPQIASQLLYAGFVSDLKPFATSPEVLRRLLIPVSECPERHHEWNPVLQAAFSNAVAWQEGASHSREGHE